jgi:hypothetical protein
VVAGPQSGNTNAPGKILVPVDWKAKPSRPVVKTRDDWIDIAWSLINSEEFLYRH